MSRVKIFEWPEARLVLPDRRWLSNPGMDSQHRYWSTADGWMSCAQDYTSEDYHQVMGVAEVFGVADHIIDFKANVEDSLAVAIFYGPDAVEPIRRVFLCTARELLLIEMEFFPGWNSEAQSMLDAYVRACETELTRSI